MDTVQHYDPTPVAPAISVDENRVAGTVGAFLFALVGGAIYFLLYQVGFLAAISGIVAVVCAFKGYAVFAKKESTYGVVISIVMAVLVIVLAWYLCLALDVYKAYQGWYESGEVDFTVSYFDSVRYAYRFLEEPEIASGYIRDLLISVLLCVFGCIAPIRTAAARAKAKAAPQAAVPVPAPMPVEQPAQAGMPEAADQPAGDSYILNGERSQS